MCDFKMSVRCFARNTVVCVTARNILDVKNLNECRFHRRHHSESNIETLGRKNMEACISYTKQNRNMECLETPFFFLFLKVSQVC